MILDYLYKIILEIYNNDVLLSSRTLNVRGFPLVILKKDIEVIEPQIVEDAVTINVGEVKYLSVHFITDNLIWMTEGNNVKIQSSSNAKAGIEGISSGKSTVIAKDAYGNLYTCLVTVK